MAELSIEHEVQPDTATTIPDTPYTVTARSDEEAYVQVLASGALRLHSGPEWFVQSNVPAGVSVELEWGVHSADGGVYQTKDGTQATAVREATLLYRGVPGDPERTPEPGCAPASRYRMHTPRGTVSTGWRWPAYWTPPPDTPAN